MVEIGPWSGPIPVRFGGVVTLIYEAQVVGGEAEPGVETTEVRGFAPNDIPWDDLAFSTTEAASGTGCGLSPVTNRGTRPSSTSSATTPEVDQDVRAHRGHRPLQHRRGALEELKVGVQRVVQFIDAREPQLISYGFYIDEENRTMTVVAVHPDSTSLELHMEWVARVPSCLTCWP